MLFDDVLIHFSKSLMEKDNEDDILWELAKNCISKLGFVDCVVCMVNRTNNTLIQKAAFGPKNPRDRVVFKPMIVKLGEGITGHVALSGNPELINDTSKDPRYLVDDAVRLSKICVPLRYESETIGVIDCEHPERNFFTPNHLKMLSVIASICTIKIKSVRSTQRLLQEQRQLLKIKEEVVDLRLKTLHSQLHPHFVFNVINAIQSNVANADKLTALDQLSTFSKLLRFHLKYLGLEVVPLSEEIKMLHCYLKLQQFRYENAFRYELVLVEKAGEATIPTSILLTLFENLIEYSMSQQHTNSHFTIRFTVKEHEVGLDVDLKGDFGHAVMDYTPEYRKQQMKWEHQIELLNDAKAYNIKKEVVFPKNQPGIGNIRLSLPNLA
ncbi:MAG: histidine kinase [Bacteroidota bacterium]